MWASRSAYFEDYKQGGNILPAHLSLGGSTTMICNIWPAVPNVGASSGFTSTWFTSWWLVEETAISFIGEKVSSLFSSAFVLISGAFAASATCCSWFSWLAVLRFRIEKDNCCSASTSEAVKLFALIGGRWIRTRTNQRRHFGHYTTEFSSAYLLDYAKYTRSAWCATDRWSCTLVGRRATYVGDIPPANITSREREEREREIIPARIPGNTALQISYPCGQTLFRSGEHSVNHMNDQNVYLPFPSKILCVGNNFPYNQVTFLQSGRKFI